MCENIWIANYICNPRTGEARESPRHLRSTTVAELVVPGSVKNLVPKNELEFDWYGPLDIACTVHMCTHPIQALMNTHADTHTCTDQTVALRGCLGELRSEAI